MDSAYDLSLTSRAPVGGERCRSAAHTPATALVWAGVFVEPDTTGLRTLGQHGGRLVGLAGP